MDKKYEHFPRAPLPPKPMLTKIFFIRMDKKVEHFPPAERTKKISRDVSADSSFQNSYKLKTTTLESGGGEAGEMLALNYITVQKDIPLIARSANTGRKWNLQALQKMY